MGGWIWADSVPGKGSTFYFTARFGIQPSPLRIASPVEINLHGVKTLVADDNATNRLILKEALSSWGAMVTEVPGAKKSLAELQRAYAARESGINCCSWIAGCPTSMDSKKSSKKSMRHRAWPE